MATEETKHPGDTTTSGDFKSSPMGHMLSKMMNTCCTAEGGSSACASMMKEMMEGMENPSSRSQQESRAESGEEKKK